MTPRLQTLIDKIDILTKVIEDLTVAVNKSNETKKKNKPFDLGTINEADFTVCHVCQEIFCKCKIY